MWESSKEGKKGEKKENHSRAKEPAISRGGARVIRRGRRKIRPAIVSHTRACATAYLQIPPPVSGSTAGANGGSVVGSGGEDERGGGEGGGSRSMNEAECVLAIANGLCQAFRDLATAVLNPRMRAATRYLTPALSGELYAA